MAQELAPELLLPPSVSKRRGILHGPPHLGGAAGAGGRGLGIVPSAPRRHATLVPLHEGPLLGLGGVRGPAGPLVPPRRRGVIRELHHLRLGTAGGRSHLRRLRWRLHLRLRDHGRPSWRRGRHHRPRRHIRGRSRRLRPLRLLRSGRHRGRHLHRSHRRGLRLRGGRRRGPPGNLWLRRGGLIRRPGPRGLGRALRARARRRARSLARPPRRAPPGGDQRVRPQHLGRCKRRNGRHRPAQSRTES
jgi:hypothetical protein